MKLWRGNLFLQKQGHAIATFDPATGLEIREVTAPIGFLQYVTRVVNNYLIYNNKVFILARKSYLLAIK